MKKCNKVSNVKQHKARKKTFESNQYWCIGYTEVLDSEELDHKTIVKARSAELAKQILVKKLNEKEDFVKVRSITISLIHSKWCINSLSRPLSISQWESIRAVSFPNDYDRIFNFTKPRTEDQSNRFNTSPYRDKPLTEERLTELRQQAKHLSNHYNKNSFKPLCPDLVKLCNNKHYIKKHKLKSGFASLNIPEHKEKEIEYLKEIMVEYGGNLQYITDSLNFPKGAMQRALKRFSEVDWKNDYPLTFVREIDRSYQQTEEYKLKMSIANKKRDYTPPPNKKGTKVYEKWKKSITPTLEAKKQKRNDKYKSEMIKFLRQTDHDRAESAKLMGISKGYFEHLVLTFKKLDPDFKKEFCGEAARIKVIEANKKRFREKRIAFLKENKHLILQAYHQNNECYSYAAKAFNVNPTTFLRWMQDIKKYEV